jgi:hypothetical protein
MHIQLVEGILEMIGRRFLGNHQRRSNTPIRETARGKLRHLPFSRCKLIEPGLCAHFLRRCAGLKLLDDGVDPEGSPCAPRYVPCLSSDRGARAQATVTAAPVVAER